MASKVDGVIEAVYSFVPDEEQWLSGIVDALAPYSLSRGILAYVSSLGEPIAMRTIVNRSEEDTEEAKKVALHQPPAFYRRIHAPIPLGFSQRVFAQIAKELGFNLNQALRDAPYKTPDAIWALCGGDANVESTLVAFMCRDGEEHSARDRRTLDCVAAHIGSALRLRSLLHEAPTGDHEAVDAVLSPDGKVLDARNEMKEADERAPLIQALRRSEKAKLRRATPDERLDVWTALVECRYSLLESIERDGKRTLLVCRNDPRTSPLRMLTERESTIASLVALGHSYKYIGYELGLPISTIAASFQDALRKLGLTSRTELIQILARGG